MDDVHLSSVSNVLSSEAEMPGKMLKRLIADRADSFPRFATVTGAGCIVGTLTLSTILCAGRKILLMAQMEQ